MCILIRIQKFQQILFMFQARLNSIAKQQSYEDSKTDYFNQLQKTNEAQKQHYFELMPKVFQVNK